VFQKNAANVASVVVVRQTWQTSLTHCWSLLWWEYQAFRTKLLSADDAVTNTERRILNQCYYVRIMQLPQKTSKISITHDYKVILLCMAATAMPAKVSVSEMLSFRW